MPCLVAPAKGGESSRLFWRASLLSPTARTRGRAPPYNGRVAGTLFVVATPIGNLSDLSFRAVETLRSADWIACEDTRHTRKLLSHYGIEGRLVSYHEHNEKERSEELLERLEKGATIALVTDAGTPLISDPGFRLVRKASEMGLRVVPVPGTSAIMTALCAAGLETDRFFFGGFLPRKPAERRRLLEELSALEATLIFYEAPHRIRQALEDIEAVMGARPVVIARELTKLHEEFLRGSPAALRELLERRGAVQGEITLLIGKGESKPASGGGQQDVAEQLRRLEQQGMPRMEAIKAISRRLGLPKREVYRLAGLLD
jgi:16S rRNA (cytidine1402-2'-O)-methyltransferase